MNERPFNKLELQCLRNGWSLGLAVDHTDYRPEVAARTLTVEGPEPFLPVRIRVRDSRPQRIHPVDLAAIQALRAIRRGRRGDWTSGVREPRKPIPPFDQDRVELDEPT